MSECPNQPDLTEMVTAVKVLAEKIDLLVSQYQQIVRWLLIVVCIIALGRSGIDVARDLISKNVQAQEVIK